MPSGHGLGRFLTIEGGEGVGKSSFQSGFAAALKNFISAEVILTREPGGTPSANRIRALFGQPPEDDPLMPETEALLVSAARAQHVGRLLRPALARGAWIISDRYHDSMRAYQGALGGVAPKALEDLIAFSTGALDPDLTFLLDCDVDVALGRVKKRSDGAKADEILRYDGAKKSVHEKLRQGFLALQKLYPARIMILDATKSPESLVAEAMGIVRARLL